MTQLFATYVQFLGHDGWGGQAIVGLLLLSGTLEAFTSGGQAGGKVIVGFIESRSLLAQVMGYVGGVIGLFMMWWIPNCLAKQAFGPCSSVALFFGLPTPVQLQCFRSCVVEVLRWSRFRQDLLLDDHDLQWYWRIGATGWASYLNRRLDRLLHWRPYCFDHHFGILIYTWLAGDKARKAAWYKSDEELAKEAAEAHIHAKA